MASNRDRGGSRLSGKNTRCPEKPPESKHVVTAVFRQDGKIPVSKITVIKCVRVFVIAELRALCVRELNPSMPGAQLFLTANISTKSVTWSMRL
jgi:hypothetical protein